MRREPVDQSHPTIYLLGIGEQDLTQEKASSSHAGRAGKGK